MENSVHEMITECYDSLFLKAYYLQSRFNYRDEDEAADIVHDACAHCITKFDDFKGGSFKAWAKSIVFGKYIDKKRKDKKFKLGISDDITTILQDTSEFGTAKMEHYDDAVANIEYERCIEKLTKKERDLYEHQVKGIDEDTGKLTDPKTLSKILGIPYGTVGRILTQAKKKLGSCLNNAFFSDKPI